MKVCCIVTFLNSADFQMIALMVLIVMILFFGNVKSFGNSNEFIIIDCS